MGPFSFFSSRKPADAVSRASRGIAAARRHGRHTYRGDWQFSLEAEVQQVTSTLILWCREVVASSRRPFGIDYFDLAVTIEDGSAIPPQSFSLQKLRPLVLYGTPLEAKIAEFIGCRRTTASAPERPLRVSTALFSWGDAAHEALPATW
jgi:hypothetical protein